MNYFLHLLIYFDIYLIIALGLNLVVGYCGLLTLTHAGYYAIGGYSYAILAIRFGWGFIPAAFVGVMVAVVLSLAVSFPAWRLRGDFFVLASLAVQALIFSSLYNLFSPSEPLGTWRNLTNGALGISAVPAPQLFGWKITTLPSFSLFATSIAVTCALVLYRLKRSPWGKLLKAMRDDELAARGLGKNTRLAKTQAFAFACGSAAVAGALYASYVRYIDPSSASLGESILMLSMVIVGGVGNFRGPIVGALVLITIPEALRFLALPDAQAANLRLLIYGVALIFIVHFRPKGIAGEYRME